MAKLCGVVANTKRMRLNKNRTLNSVFQYSNAQVAERPNASDCKSLKSRVRITPCAPFYVSKYTMEQQNKQWIIDNLIPLGEVRLYQGNGNFVLDGVYQNARFIKERTSNIVRRPISNRSLINYPSQMISYGYHHAITSAVYEDPYVYHVLEQTGIKVEDSLSNYISSCDHAVVLFAHQSVTDEMIVHTHRLSDSSMFSLTVAIRLTHDDATPIEVKLYPPLDDVPDIEQYFNNPNALLNYININPSVNTSLVNDRTLFVFNAGYTPHNVNFTDDIMLYFIYDNVEFKGDAFEEIKSRCQDTLFENSEESKRAYFWHL